MLKIQYSMFTVWTEFSTLTMSSYLIIHCVTEKLREGTWYREWL